MTRPRVYLRALPAPDGSRAFEWLSQSARCTRSPEVAGNYQLRDRRASFFSWLAGLLAQAKGGKAGW